MYRYPALVLTLICAATESSRAQSEVRRVDPDHNQWARIEPEVQISTTATGGTNGDCPWKCRIVTTTFWVGETPTRNNPIPNRVSAWDDHWAKRYGGYDDPDSRNRRDYIPVNFIPSQNPFYVALPYNDVSRGHAKPEAPLVIPWFKAEFTEEGRSVCHGHWVAIRHGARTAYAQWEDCGPFRTDHWGYVFGNDRPKPNMNKGAGLDVSPAVRDYLRMGETDTTDWRFVETREVPVGPWRLYGDNNTFVINGRKSGVALAAMPGGQPRVELN
jgi:hypothetical protein